MTKDQVLKTLQHLKKEISKNYKAEIQGIFGSYAREDQNLDSDVDILVKFQQGATLLDLARLSRFLEDKLQLKVDIVSERALRKEIESEIYKDLVLV